MDTPCEPWTIDKSCWELPEGDHAELIEKWQMVASTLLWRLSGRRWGLCEETVRPCRSSCLDVPLRGVGLQPYISKGRWYNAVTCGCGTLCSCTSLCVVKLPGPVNSIESVQLDGVVLEPESYRVDNHNELVRQDDECWPDCQDMRAPDGEPGTFSVTYLQGLPIDESAIQAVSAYTYEFVKSCIPDCETCRLPKRVTQITRQGISAQFIDPQDYLENGLTGLEYVDDWIKSVNPNGLKQRPRIYSPDYQGEPRRTTWSAPV